MGSNPKPCDCETCEERDSIAKVLRDEIDYQMRKKSNPLSAYAITILRQVLDGIKNSGPAGKQEA